MALTIRCSSFGGFISSPFITVGKNSPSFVPRRRALAGSRIWQDLIVVEGQVNKPDLVGLPVGGRVDVSTHAREADIEGVQTHAAPIAENEGDLEVCVGIHRDAEGASHLTLEHVLGAAQATREDALSVQ